MEILTQIEDDIRRSTSLSVLHCSFSGKNRKEVILNPFSRGEKNSYSVILPGGTITTVQIFDPEMVKRIEILMDQQIPYILKYEDMMDDDQTRIAWCFLMVHHTKELKSRFKNNQK